MKGIILNFFYSIILLFRLDGIVRFLTRNKVTIISYHAPDLDSFRRHVRYLDKYFNFISLDEFIEAKINKTVRYLPRNSMVVTIDDGHKSNELLFDVFKEYQIKPTIYCCSNVVGTNHNYWWSGVPKSKLEYYKKLTNKERLAELKKDYGYSPYSCGEQLECEALSLDDMQNLIDIGGIVGAHTRSHPILSKCDDETLEDEIGFSKTELEEKIKRRVEHFAYPNGVYTLKILDYIEKSGYLSARTTKVGWNTQKTKTLELKVIGVSDGASIKKLRVTLTGLPGLLINFLYRKTY